jgi:calcium/calmodulin-dependent protein kinase kinase 2
VKAVNKFKSLIGKDKPHAMTSILGEQGGAHFSYPPASMPKENVALPPKSHSIDLASLARSSEGSEFKSISQDLNKLKVRPVPTLSIDDTTLSEQPGKAEDRLTHTNTASEESIAKMQTIAEIEHLDPDKLPPFRTIKSHAYTTDETGHKGHAHDPLEDQLYLYIGPSTFSGFSNTADDDTSFVSGDGDGPIVSESPGAADVDIYETAYRDEIERIMARAKEEQKEPNVYLTRRVDERLMAISGLAGKWAAKGEEARNQLKDYTQFSARKARVTEVSRALRQAAKEEYERRRQEHREWIAAEKAERAKAKEQDSSNPATPGSPPTPGLGHDVEESATDRPQSPGRHSTVWKGKAVDAGRQAKTSLMGLMDMVKNKSRTRSKDEAN